MARRRTFPPELGFLDVLLDNDGEPPCDPPDQCLVCQLWVLPLEQIGELFRLAPTGQGRSRGKG